MEVRLQSNQHMIYSNLDQGDRANELTREYCRYEYTWAAIIAIGVSAVLGLMVSLSTFLVIGATSSLTYNVRPSMNTGLSCTKLAS